MAGYDVMTKLPRPREDLAGFPPYRTQQQKADVRLNANEWADPNPAGQWLTPDELDAVLLNRYPSAAVDLRAVLAQRYGVQPDQIVLEQRPRIGANRNKAPSTGPMTAETKAARCATGRMWAT